MIARLVSPTARYYVILLSMILTHAHTHIHTYIHTNIHQYIHYLHDDDDDDDDDDYYYYYYYYYVTVNVHVHVCFWGNYELALFSREVCIPCLTCNLRTSHFGLPRSFECLSTYLIGVMAAWRECYKRVIALHRPGLLLSSRARALCRHYDEKHSSLAQ